LPLFSATTVRTAVVGFFAAIAALLVFSPTTTLLGNYNEQCSFQVVGQRTNNNV
jgi:hypothetical protein